MPIQKEDLARLIMARAANEAEKAALLLIAGEKPGLWELPIGKA